MTDVEAAFAAGRIKEPLTVNFLLESKDKPTIVGILTVTLLTSFVVLGRVLSRVFIVRRFGIDDALASLSWACFIVFVGLCIELIKLGSGRHFAYIEYVLPVKVVMRTQVLDFAAHIVYTTALVLCRVSGLAFYHRICGLHRGFRRAIQIVGGIIVAGYLPQLLLIVFHCRPVTGLWPYGFEPGAADYECLQWGLVYSVNSAVSLLCDLLLFGIPVAILYILEINRKRKIQLACILLPGTCVIIISIVRLILVIKGQWETDMSWSYDPMLGVETSEVGATLIALSVPGLKPILDKYILNKDPKTYGTNSRYHRGTGGLPSKGTPLSTLRMRSDRSVLTSQEDSPAYHNEVRATSSKPTHSSQEGREGILVKMDFAVEEEEQRDMVGHSKFVYGS